MFLTAETHAFNIVYPIVEKMAGFGAMVVMGRSTKIWNQRQGAGHYRVDLGFLRPENFAINGPVDLSNAEAVKNLMLQDDFFQCGQ
jgi:hypothetical protein